MCVCVYVFKCLKKIVIASLAYIYVCVCIIKKQKDELAFRFSLLVPYLTPFWVNIL